MKPNKKRKDKPKKVTKKAWVIQIGRATFSPTGERKKVKVYLKKKYAISRGHGKVKEVQITFTP